MDPNQVVPGTGQTVQDLLNIGYSQADIQSLMSPTVPDTSIAAQGAVDTGVHITTMIPSIISTIGTTFANVERALNQPQVINPRTGQPLTQQQLQTLASNQAALGPVGNLGSLLPFAVIFLLAYVLLKK